MFGEHIREFQKYMVFGILDDNGLSKGPTNDTNVLTMFSEFGQPGFVFREEENLFGNLTFIIKRGDAIWQFEGLRL